MADSIPGKDERSNRLFLTVNELEEIFSNIIKSLKEGTDLISISDDYYWVQLNEDERYNE